MSNEGPSLILAGISGVIALFALFVSISANKRSSASLELTIGQSITDAKNRYDDIRRQLLGIQNPSGELVEGYEQSKRIAIENYLNAYEEACRQYRAGNISRGNFYENHRLSIRELMESETMQEHMKAASGAYGDIREVYAQWKGRN